MLRQSMDNGSKSSDVTIDTTQMDNMIELDELSEADVRHERCPSCHYNPLKRNEGFKVCPRCQTIFKVIDGKGYVVMTKETELSNEENVLPVDQQISEEDVSPKSEVHGKNKLSRLRKIAKLN